MAILRKNPNEEFDKLKHVAAQARLPFDREGWLNLAFYLDEQYVEWHQDTGNIRRIPRDKRTPNAPRPIVNKIMHFSQQERALALQAKPTVDVLPATDDMMDITDAAVAKSYCQYVAEPINANFLRQLSRAALWAIVASEGWLKWCWNPVEKRPDIVACSPFEIYPDPYAKDFAKARWMIHSQFMDVEQVYEAWGVEVPPGKVEEVDPMRSELLRGMGSTPVLSGVTVNELWQKPSRRHPQGRYAVWCGNKQLVQPGPLPYQHKRLPFTQIGSVERPDSPHYMSPVKYLRSAQMELNKYHAQKIMSREAFANYKWWIPAELELERLPDDSPRQILRGHSQNGMLKPEILTPPGMPDNNDGAMIEEQMMHIVGLREVSQGQVPGRVEAAKAIELLKESDADRTATLHDTISAAVSEGFYQVLMLAKQYVREDVLVQAYSREGLPEVKHFKASKIKPGMRVHVTMGSGLARSRSARQDQLMNLWQQKIITDPELMAELMEVPFPSFAQPKALDMRLARNENLEMSKDVAVSANSWDDHDIHLREHNDYRKTDEYRNLPEDVRRKYEFHTQQHETMQEDHISRQARLALLMQGQQPGAPQPGQDPAADSATPPPTGGTVT